jgi:hypothetical protein
LILGLAYLRKSLDLSIPPIAVMLGQNRRQVAQTLIANGNAGASNDMLHFSLGSAAESARRTLFTYHAVYPL